MDEFAAPQRYTLTEKAKAEVGIHSSGTCVRAVWRWPAKEECKGELQQELRQQNTTDNASSTWVPILEAKDFEIAFVHPVGTEFVEAAYGEGEWVDGAFPPVRQTPSGMKHELYLMRSTGGLSPWVACAKDGFARFGDKDVNKALRHTDAVHEDQARPQHKLA